MADPKLHCNIVKTFMVKHYHCLAFNLVYESFNIVSSGTIVRITSRFLEHKNAFNICSDSKITKDNEALRIYYSVRC